jgi:hypothetical protein
MYIEVQQLQKTWTLICPACRQQATSAVSFLLDAHGMGCDDIVTTSHLSIEAALERQARRLAPRPDVRRA